MTKYLTIVLILTLIAILSWVGWLFFENASVLSQLNFSEKSAEPLNPVLQTGILQ
jgi:hypothetical protein